jgi:hypothetical protein
MVTTKPTTQAGSCSNKRKNARPPYCPGVQTPAHAATKPVELTSSSMTKTQIEAMLHPIHRSLSVFDANARIQNPDRNRLLNTIPTKRIYMSWYPKRLGSASPEGPILEVSIDTDVPTAIVQMTMRRPIKAPWMLSVMKDTRNPPKAEEYVNGSQTVLR